MDLPITKTKITIPRRLSWTWTRQRLISYLDDLLEYRLTLIAAPAGYGKTTLLVDLAHQVEYPVAWLALDPLDQDFHRFLLYFIAAINNQFPDFGMASASLITSLGKSEKFTQQILQTIVNDIYENIHEHFALVLDDYHLVDQNQEINNFINQFAREMDENSHLVIASRSLLSLPDLPLLVGRSQVKGVSFEELAFRSEEIEALLNQKYRLEITQKDAIRLLEETEGWVTGLLLSAKTTGIGLEEHGRASRTTGVDLYDYLAQQVLDQQDPKMKAFLLQTSVLEEFNEKLLFDTLGHPPDGGRWQTLINKIQDHNLFVQPVENEGTWLRYHHLFRDFLQHQFHQLHPDQELELFYQLFKTYNKYGWLEKAYEICCKIGDPELTEEFIQSTSSILFHNGQINLLNSWIEDLPRGLIESSPGLLGIHGSLTSVLGSPKDGLQILNRALRIQKKDGEINSELTSTILLRRATCHRLLGDYPAGKDDVLAALNNIQNPVLEAEAERELGLLARRMGDLETANKHLNKSLDLYQLQKDHRNTAFVEMDLGSVVMNQGDYSAARELYKNSFQIWSDIGNITQMVEICNNLGVLDHLSGNYKESYFWLNKALNHSRMTASLRGEAFTLASLGDLAADLGAFTQALEYYSKSKDIAEAIDESFLKSYLEVTTAALEIRRGNLKQAEIILSEMKSDIDDFSELVQGRYHQESGKLLYTQDQLDSAYKAFETAQEVFRNVGMPVEYTESKLFQYLILSQTARNSKARLKFHQSDLAVSHLDTITPLVPKFLNHLDKLKKNSEILFENISITDLVQEIEKFKNNLPEILDSIELNPPVKPVQERYHLEIQALGRIEIKRDGKKVSASEWVHQKTVRELFFYLLCQPSGASKDEICTVFWPNSSPEQLKKQFKNALYRLRRSLGKETVIFHKPTRLYHFNRNLYYWYDVEKFLEEASRAESTGSITSKIDRLKIASDLYQHPFAPTLEGIWVEPERYKLQRTFERLMVTRIELLLSQELFNEVLEASRKLLAVTPGHEAVWRFAMQAQAGKGNRSGVKREFESCKRALEKYLDLKPSPETKNLYQNLLG